MVTIEIFWQDLTEKKQKEIEEIIGTDHIYDVFPIVMLDVELDAD